MHQTRYLYLLSSRFESLEAVERCESPRLVRGNYQFGRQFSLKDRARDCLFAKFLASRSSPAVRAADSIGAQVVRLGSQAAYQAAPGVSSFGTQKARIKAGETQLVSLFVYILASLSWLDE